MKQRNDSPRFLASLMDAEVQLPTGKEERFNGYGVMGLTFDTGHVLALRRLGSSSVGHGYTSVWHRTPGGTWTFYTNVTPGQGCARYFGSAVDDVRVSEIEIEWVGPQSLSVTVPEADLEWSMQLADTRATRALNTAGDLLPHRLWRNRAALSLMGRIASWALDAGTVELKGCVPNGQYFMANPRILWSIESSSAVLGGQPLGCPAPLEEQARLGDFWIPNRGVFAFGQAYFEPFNDTKHSSATSRTDETTAVAAKA
jgi:hypothetical protein